MEDVPDEDRRPGPEEQRVLDTFDRSKHPDGCFRFVSVVQYAPDPQHITGQIYFLVCPLCGSMVPVPPEERPDLPFDEDHVQWHLKVARLEDRLDG